jgi:carboxypeptidase C (cathepsin A)
MQLSDKLSASVTARFYPGGHMMYVNEGNLQKLKNDLVEFYATLNGGVKK